MLNFPAASVLATTVESFLLTGINSIFAFRKTLLSNVTWPLTAPNIGTGFELRTIGGFAFLGAGSADMLGLIVGAIVGRRSARGVVFGSALKGTLGVAVLVFEDDRVFGAASIRSSGCVASGFSLASGRVVSATAGFLTTNFSELADGSGWVLFSNDFSAGFFAVGISGTFVGTFVEMFSVSLSITRAISGGLSDCW